MKRPRTLKQAFLERAMALWHWFSGTWQHWPLGVSLIATLNAIWQFGVSDRADPGMSLQWLAISSMMLGLAAHGIRYSRAHTRPPVQAWIPDLLYAILLLWCLSALLPFSSSSGPAKLIFWVPGVVFFREFANYPFLFRRRTLQPAQLFIASFILIILSGTLLLKAPNATHTGISFLDALFTSTSAVCVTGLIVVDTATHFTRFGQWVLIFLMQVGGLGVMTFTSYFAYFFRGGMSYESQLMMNDMANSKKLSDVFNTLKRVILLTLGVEGLGALLIYLSLSDVPAMPETERVFFAIFHAVSGFCNAGFSTLTNSLFETGFNTNYPLLSIVMGLFILGGIGFPIMYNFWRYVKYRAEQALSILLKRKTPQHQPWIIEVNSRIVLITTGLLLLVGTLLIYLFEYDNTLAEHKGIGKMIAALFCASTPRTAGFNMVDSSAMMFPSIMLVLFLMWIGASPASTGGGIKTSTLAIGTLNFISLARGKERIEVFRREIALITIRRAFALISLSLATIGIAVFAISWSDPDLDLLHIAFECFSAYSTVGLSLGITPELSNPAKWVIILTMFVGRVSMLTILIALFRRFTHVKYRYPSEEILIN